MPKLSCCKLKHRHGSVAFDVMTSSVRNIYMYAVTHLAVGVAIKLAEGLLEREVVAKQ